MPDTESLKAKYTEQELRQTRLEIVSMSLSDNIFFVNVMKNTRLFSHILSLLLGERMDVIGPIKEVETEHTIDLSCAGSRSVRLDAVGNSQTINIFSRKNQFGEEYGDESYIYVVNINTMTDDALGRMLRSIKEPDPSKIEDDVIRDVVSSAKGDKDMELSIHDTKIQLTKEREEALFREGLRKGLEQGLEQGVMQEKIRMILSLYSQNVSKEIISSSTGFSIDEIDRIIKENS